MKRNFLLFAPLSIILASCSSPSNTQVPQSDNFELKVKLVEYQECLEQFIMIQGKALDALIVKGKAIIEPEQFAYGEALKACKNYRPEK